MPYLGNIPATQFAELKYQDFTGGTGTSFTLNDPVGSAQELEVFVNNVRQEPGVAYTVSGTALTMTGSIVATDDFYVVFQGKSTGTATHPAGQALTATDGTFTGDLTVDTNTLHVDASNNRVGVGTASPTEPFHIVGASGAATDMQIQGGDDTNSVRLFMGGNTNPLHGRIVYSTASDFMAFSTGGDQRVRVDSDGLKFGSDTAAANALDDYEEGSFTPTITFGGGSTGMTFTSQNGRYTKIGNMCTVYVEMNLSNKGSSTGSVVYGGLPFTAASDIQDRAVTLQMFRDVPSGSDNLAHLFHVFPQNSQSGCILRSTISTGDAGPDDSDYDNNTRVSYSLTYKTA